MSLYAIILGSALGVMLFSHYNCDNNTLRMIAVIFRHGDRSPGGTYKNDPYSKYQWQGGIGALSPKGYHQMYMLGRNLHARYKTLLPSDGFYTRELINVQSSVAERAIMSAQCFLAGLMPLNENDNPLPMTWQPAAIYVLPLVDDYLILALKPCPKYDKEYDSLLRHPAFLEENRDLIQYITEHSGEDVVKDPLFIAALCDTLHIQESKNLTLPEWTNKIYPDILRPFQLRLQIVRTETPYMKKMKGGALVTEIVTNMEKKISNTLNPNRSIFVYSGHDVTITNVVNALGVRNETINDVIPNHGAAVVFELHQNDEVKLVYYSDYAVRFPQEISIPNCEKPCLLTKFRELIKPIEMNIENYDELCKIEE